MTTTRTCPICRETFTAKHPSARYCSERCKKRAQRSPERVAEVVELPQKRPEGALSVATRRELEEAGRLGTAAGQRAMLAALRLDTATADTGSSVAALLRAHSEALAEAVKDAKGASDPLEEIRGAAALKLIAGGRG